MDISTLYSGFKRTGKKNIPFKYNSQSGQKGEGSIKVISDEKNLEVEIQAGGNSFHVIVGRHRDGNFICVPNWNIGSELGDLSDEFWNYERLCNYTSLDEDHIIIITRALAEINR